MVGSGLCMPKLGSLGGKMLYYFGDHFNVQMPIEKKAR